MRLVTLESWHLPQMSRSWRICSRRGHDARLGVGGPVAKEKWMCCLQLIHSTSFQSQRLKKGGLDLQLSLISKNYLVMGQVARPLPRTASDSERIQAIVARHSQSWSSPALGLRLRIRSTQPLRSKSSVQEGSAYKSPRGRSELSRGQQWPDRLG